MMEARSLKGPATRCDFDRVDVNSAGYTAAGICRTTTGTKPGRLSIITPNQAWISTLTISGGPFTDATALQRCAAQ